MSLTLSRPLALVAAGLLLLASGCAGLPKHEVNVSASLKAHPVQSVFIFDPGFPKKVSRLAAEDLPEMAPENQAASIQQVMTIIKGAIGSSLVVESSYTPDEDAQAWAQDISEDLAKGRVPLGVEPVKMPVESVLLLGLLQYGQKQIQIRVRPLPFLPFMKTYKVGKEKWEYTCDLQALLVNPREGTVLFDVRHDARTSSPRNDPRLLEQVATEAAWAVVNALPPPAE